MKKVLSYEIESIGKDQWIVKLYETQIKFPFFNNKKTFKGCLGKKTDIGRFYTWISTSAILNYGVFSSEDEAKEEATAYLVLHDVINR